MKLSKVNKRKPEQVLTCPLAAAATFIDEFNVSDMARMLGKNAKTLLGKLNNDNEQNRLYLDEAIQITNLTNDHRIPLAWVTGLGYLTVPIPQSNLSDEELSDQLLTVQERVGELSRAIRLGRADGVISRKDYADIKAANLSAIVALLQLEREIETMVRSSPDDDLHDD